MSATPEAVLEFWFGDALDSPEAVTARSEIWFGGDPSFDERIRESFGDLPSLALRGGLDSWREAARSSLALVLVLDQFPRNLYRDRAEAFAYDPLGLEVAVAAIKRRFDTELAPLEASFLYMPLEHSEDIELQDRCVALFEGLLERAPASQQAQFDLSLSFAIRHREVIRRFGRFPHRNAALARQSTHEERSYLESDGDPFGGAAKAVISTE